MLGGLRGHLAQGGLQVRLWTLGNRTQNLLSEESNTTIVDPAPTNVVFCEEGFLSEVIRCAVFSVQCSTLCTNFTKAHSLFVKTKAIKLILILILRI